MVCGLPTKSTEPVTVCGVWALCRLQEGKPCLVEAMTYRIGHHSTSDDSTRCGHEAEGQADRETRWYHSSLTKIAHRSPVLALGDGRRPQVPEHQRDQALAGDGRPITPLPKVSLPAWASCA